MTRKMGCEVEIRGQSRDWARGLVRKYGGEAETDGSIRWYSHGEPYELFKYPLEGLEFYSRPNHEMAAEIVSAPLEPADMSRWFSNIASVCKGVGEQAYANTSIHIHISDPGLGMPEVRWAYSYMLEHERIFYQVSAMPGERLRGEYNQFLYYRPLEYPQAAMDQNRQWRPSIGNVLGCYTKDQLSYTLGRLDLDHVKWIPGRYCGFNLVPFVGNFGTWEFRYFNLMFNPQVFNLWVGMVNAVVQMALEKKEMPMAEAVHRQLDNIGLHPLEIKNSLSWLENFVEREVTLPTTWIKTHTGRMIDWGKPPANFTLSEADFYQPRPIPEDVPVVDVENPHPDDLLGNKPLIVI